MKKCAKSFLMIFILTVLLSNINSKAQYSPPFELKTEAVYLVNLDTGTVIYEKNAQKKMYPASLTKIMTSLLAIEMTPDLDGTIVKAKASILNQFYGQGVSLAGILAGEELTMRELLYCMLLQSGNESASITADFLGDESTNNFLSMMNKRAKELGANNTNFVNPNGLFDEQHYTTAYDLYLITKKALEYDVFRDIVSTPTYQLRKTNKRESEVLINTNKMLFRGSPYYSSYIKGVKTGTLTPSGRCFISLASKDGYNYLCILLNAPYKDENGKVLENNYAFSETKQLHDWAFSNFKIKTLIDTNETVAQIKLELVSGLDHLLLVPEKKFTALIPEEIDPSSVQRIPNVSESVRAPIKKGQVLGYVQLMLAGEEIGRVNLIAPADIERTEWLYYLDIFASIVGSFWFKLAVGILLLLFVLYIIYSIYQNQTSKKYRKINRRRRF